MDKLDKYPDLDIGMPAGVNFFDIDWQDFFDGMRCSYANPRDFRGFLRDDGTFDLEKLSKEDGWIDPGRFIKEDGRPDVDKIIAAIGGNNEFIVFAVPDPSVLDPADILRIQEAIAVECSRLLEGGDVPRLFSLLENIFPLFCDSFEILEERLPRVVKKEYLGRMPSYLGANTDEEYYDELLCLGFDPSEAQSLAPEVNRYRHLIYFWRAITRKGGFKLKKPVDGKSYVEREIVEGTGARVRGLLEE